MARRHSTAAHGLTRKQLSRKARETRIQRIVLIGTAMVAVVVIGLLVYGVIYNQIIKPTRVIASVNGETITVKEFEDRVRFEYFLYTRNQLFNYIPFNALDVLNSMVEEKVIKQQAAEMGIVLDEAELLKETQLLVGYDEGEPEPTDTPYPTPITPEGSATFTPTFVFTQTPTIPVTLDPSITPTETPKPTATLEPDVTPTETPEPTITLTPSPSPTATPMTEADFNLMFNQFLAEGSSVAELPVARMHELWFDYLRGNLLRQRLTEALDFDIAQEKTMMLAAHIQAATEEEAQAAIARLEDGEDFAVVAADVSTDTETAYRGGNLGWIEKDSETGRGAAFDEALFALGAGEISDPVQDEAGLWHIIKVYEVEVVPTTFFEQQSQRQEQFQAKVDQWVADASVDIDETYPQYIPSLPQPQQQQNPFQ